MKTEANSTNKSDFESQFYLALRLLHSKSKSSADQLKAIVDEAIAQKLQRTDVNVKKERKSVIEIPAKVREAEKRPFEKKFGSIDDTLDIKKMRLQPSKLASRSLTSSPDSSAKLKFAEIKEETMEIKLEKNDDDSEATDIDEENPGTDPAELFDLEGLSCVFCKRFDTTSNNKLLECTHCREMYHQECHKPPITEDTNDPRVVWYCGKCLKSMKKLNKSSHPSPNTHTESATFATAINSGKETALQLMKAKKASEQCSSAASTAMQPFKRVEPKVPVSPVSAQSSSVRTGANPVGLAALAFNLGVPSSGSSSVTSSPGSLSPASAKTVSEKRAQIFKKKSVKVPEKKRSLQK